jgi:hypothetical protein
MSGKWTFHILDAEGPEPGGDPDPGGSNEGGVTGPGGTNEGGASSREPKSSGSELHGGNSLDVSGRDSQKSEGGTGNPRDPFNGPGDHPFGPGGDGGGSSLPSSASTSEGNHTDKTERHDEWAYGYSYGTTGFVSIGLLAIGGSASVTNVVGKAGSQHSVGGFVGGIGMAYALPKAGRSIAIVNHQATGTTMSAGFGCSPALLIVTPLGSATIAAVKQASGERRYDVSISIGLTYGGGIVGGAYCGAAIEAPRQRNEGHRGTGPY